jgi:hypothetical protein
MTVTPSPTARPELGYRMAGAGREIFTRLQIRNSIRTGEVTPHTELAYENTEDYRPASQFPELSRYLALVSQPAATAAAGKPSGPRTSVFTRILPGLIYPWTGVGPIVIVGATLLQPLPFGPIVAGLFTTVYGLAVIRESSQGSTRMPPLNAVGGPIEFVMMLLKLLVVGLVSAWPIFLAIPLMFVLRSSTIMFAAVFVMFLYIPAAVATLAKWKSIQYAIRPSQIFNFIRIVGADYVVAVLAPFFTMGATLGAGLAARMTLGPSPSELVMGLLSTWGIFYSFHLLGWGIHHHGDEF